MACDAAREDDVARMVSAGAKAFGKIDLLVNNAGNFGPTKHVQDYLMEDWRYTMNSCLTSSYLCTRFVVPEMVKAGGGAVVNISSGAGRRGLPYRIGYCAAKAGQVGMTFGMALELAPHNIRVNCVAPGAVEGERIDQVIAGQAKARGIGVEEMRKAMIARSPSQPHGHGRRHRRRHRLPVQRHGAQHLRPGARRERRAARRLRSTHMAELPSEARCVIIGGGVVGCSVAYHLAKLGWTDVVLLERKRLTSGTTWHAAGLIGQLRATLTLTLLAKYTAGLYTKLEAETGLATGFRQNGSVSIALTEERFEELKRQASMAKPFGLDVHVLTPQEARERHPLIDLKDVVGGIFIPSDGQADPANIAQALAKGARLSGVRIFENTKVTGILREKGRATGVTTDKGSIGADYVVNCAGLWGREIGRMAGVNVPLMACEHFYVVTDANPEIPRNLPVLRVPDECAYAKEDAGKLLVGFFEPTAKPWGIDSVPEDAEFLTLPDDWDHIAPQLEQAMARLPILARTGIHTFFNGPEGFTPDDR